MERLHIQGRADGRTKKKTVLETRDHTRKRNTHQAPKYTQRRTTVRDVRATVIVQIDKRVFL